MTLNTVDFDGPTKTAVQANIRGKPDREGRACPWTALIQVMEKAGERERVEERKEVPRSHNCAKEEGDVVTMEIYRQIEVDQTSKRYTQHMPSLSLEQQQKEGETI